MKIRFTAKKLPYPLSEYINEEDIGWEKDFGSSASLSEDGCIWITALSQFEYTLTEEGSETDTWEYCGAENGFLKQQLLPPIELIEVLSVEGTYGKFTKEGGEDPLGRYSELKHGLYKYNPEKVYDGLEVVNFFCHNGWKRTYFAAEVYRRRFQAGPESEDTELLESMVLQNSFRYLCEGNISFQSAVYRGENKEKSTRNITFAQFCHIVAELRRNSMNQNQLLDI